MIIIFMKNKKLSKTIFAYFFLKKGGSSVPAPVYKLIKKPRTCL